MQKINSASKTIFLTALLTVGLGVAGCQKTNNDTDTKSEEIEEVVMSADPAESETPTIVAGDLDDADAQLNGNTGENGMNQDTDDSIQDKDIMTNQKMAQTEEVQLIAPTSQEVKTEGAN